MMYLKQSQTNSEAFRRKSSQKDDANQKRSQHQCSLKNISSNCELCILKQLYCLILQHICMLHPERRRSQAKVKLNPLVRINVGDVRFWKRRLQKVERLNGCVLSTLLEN